MTVTSGAGRRLAGCPLIVGLGGALAIAGAPQRTDQRLNVLVLFTDDHRHGTLGALGHPDVRTPHLDRLVQRGTAFTRAHIMGGLQPAVCVPSRAMTGDPWEMRDLSADPSHRGRLPDMRSRLVRAGREAGDPHAEPAPSAIAPARCE